MLRQRSLFFFLWVWSLASYDSCTLCWLTLRKALVLMVFSWHVPIFIRISLFVTQKGFAIPWLGRSPHIILIVKKLAFDLMSLIVAQLRNRLTISWDFIRRVIRYSLISFPSSLQLILFIKGCQRAVSYSLALSVAALSIEYCQWLLWLVIVITVSWFFLME